MRRWHDIALALLLLVQPVVPLWAAAPDCAMAAMHATEHGGHAQKACDCCDDADCAAPCQAVVASPVALPQPLNLFHSLLTRDFAVADSDQIPAGHARPAFRPPIAR